MECWNSGMVGFGFSPSSYRSSRPFLLMTDCAEQSQSNDCGLLIADCGLTRGHAVRNKAKSDGRRRKRLGVSL
jgi:hypothetical protein